ncbi:alkyl hydroperoxide reductase [Bacillus sp. FJAT-27225]|uniref:redoxin domain-containing protein n=1 Tax=Bacillus sp. FJAT-27225 TaxID=1743144 RepID=UPI00080C323A|nr:redoxin domain-containing protein [Bacillus sp. FJAT-27225]OCA90691.1 alkyl hydroperoxide reductase [Bacillus sp. FJAT-27225]
MAKKWLAGVLLIALMAIAMVVSLGNNKEDPSTEASSTFLEAGSKASDFELKTLSGETMKLSDLEGKKVMLNFWATWCGPCKKEMPDMQKLSVEASDDLVILAVNIDPQLDVQGFVDEYGITFPVLLDEKDKVNQMYQVISIPTTYFIDSKGIIQDKFIGTMPYDAMVQYTEDLN